MSTDGQRTRRPRNIEENITRVGCTNVTDDRQTEDDGRSMPKIYTAELLMHWRISGQLPTWYYQWSTQVWRYEGWVVHTRVYLCQPLWKELHQTNSHNKFLIINAYFKTYAHIIKFYEFQIKTNHHIYGKETAGSLQILYFLQTVAAFHASTTLV